MIDPHIAGGMATMGRSLEGEWAVESSGGIKALAPNTKYPRPALFLQLSEQPHYFLTELPIS